MSGNKFLRETCPGPILMQASEIVVSDLPGIGCECELFVGKVMLHVSVAHFHLREWMQSLTLASWLP